MRTCSKDNCKSIAWARGMCNAHYCSWRYHHGPIARITARDLVLESLPGTIREITAASGLNRSTVELTIVRLCEEKRRRLFVEDWVQGGPGGNSKYVARYASGNLPDAIKPSAQARAKERRTKVNSNSQRRRLERVGDPLVLALFGKMRDLTQKNAEPC